MPTDAELLAAILGEDDPERLVRAIFIYYNDMDRAERTSRSTMYLHLGMLAGMIMRLRKPTTVSWGDTREKS